MSTSPNADEYLSDPRFHRTFNFTLPASPSHNLASPLPFQVSYADFGHSSPDNVLLIFGPLCASRLLHVAKLRLVTSHHIRIIHPDRPGFGKTTPLNPTQRLPLWREALVALLRHLGITHVAMVAHSGGTVFAVDFALHFPEFLANPSLSASPSSLPSSSQPSSPPLPAGQESEKSQSQRDKKKGVLVIAAPWILPSHSGVALLGMAKALPVGVLKWTDWTAKTVNNRIGPMAGKILGSFGGLGATETKEEGEDEKFEKGIWHAVMKNVYAEGAEGMSDEAVLLLQKHGDWSDWGDYDVAIPRLVEVLREKGIELRVDVYFAAKDTLIGAPKGKGPEWFTQCWEKSAGSDGVLEFYRHEVEGVDHDSIWSCGSRVVTEVFERLSVGAS